MHRSLVLGLTAALVMGCGQAAAPTTRTADPPAASPTLPAVTTPRPSLPSAPEATGPTPPGSILFMRAEPDGRFQTWTACVDLTRSVRVPTAPDRDAGWAVWAPDGTRIAFNANFDDPGP